MKGLNFKDWQKISSDQMSTTLRHAKGHVMTIAHKALPKIQQEQLKRLKLADGGRVKMAEAGAVEANPSSDQDSTDSDQPDQKAPSPQAAPGSPITINVGGGSSPQAAAPAPAPAAVPAIPQYTGQGPYQGPAPVSTPEVPGGDKPGVGGALQVEQKGITQGENIAAQKGSAQANYEDNYLKQTQALANRDQGDIQHLGQATQALDQYVANHPINPRAYFENMSVPSKITGTLGLILGGFAGANGKGASNPAMDYLLKQQDKDINAQISRMDQQRTVVGAYQKLFDDQVVTSNLARVNYNNMLTHQANLMAAKMGTAEAAQAANMFSAQLSKKNYLDLGQTAQRIRAIKSGEVQAVPFANAPLSKAGGMGKSQASSNEKKNEGSSQSPYDYKPSQILTPEATAQFNHLKVTPLMTPEQKGQFAEQYNRAVLADKALKSLPEIMNEMHEQAGLSGYTRRLAKNSGSGFGDTIGPVVGGLAGIIPGLGAAAGDAVYGTHNIQQDRDYDIAKTRLNDIVTNALKGANISPHQISELIDTNSPEYNDSPPTHLKKMRAIEAFIKTNANVGTLEARGAVKGH